LDPLLQQLADLTRVFRHRGPLALVALPTQTIRVCQGRQTMHTPPACEDPGAFHRQDN
jgi:hypothetical protein